MPALSAKRVNALFLKIRTHPREGCQGTLQETSIALSVINGKEWWLRVMSLEIEGKPARVTVRWRFGW